MLKVAFSAVDGNDVAERRQSALQLESDLAVLARQQDPHGSTPVLLAKPALIGTARHVLDPFLIVEIPLHCLGDTGFKGFRRFPAEFPLDLAGIDGIAAIMSGPVLHEGDLAGIGKTIGTRLQVVEDCTKHMHDLEIGLLVPATDIVGLTDPAGLALRMQSGMSFSGKW